MLMGMYEPALEIGISANDFWDMTFEEIMLEVNARQRIKKNSLRERATFDYNMAQMMVYAVNDPKKMPKIDELYPFMKDEVVEQPKAVKRVDEANQDQAVFMQMAKAIKDTRERKNKVEGG